MEPATLAWAVLGIATGGFFFLASWIRSLSDKTILDELKKINLALTGDLDKPGIMTRLHEHDRDIHSIKLRCDKNHS